MVRTAASSFLIACFTWTSVVIVGLTKRSNAGKPRRASCQIRYRSVTLTHHSQSPHPDFLDGSQPGIIQTLERAGTLFAAINKL